MQSLLKSGLVVALLIFAGRLTGFGREWLIAMKAGASEATDIAIVLLTFPDLMVGLLLGGGLAATLVPAFKRLGEGQANALMLQAGRLVGFLFALLALGLAILAPWVLGFLAPGLPEPAVGEQASAFRFITLALPMAALSGIAVARLQSRGRFALGASGTLIFNGAVIVCLLAASRDALINAVVIGALAGSLLRLALQVSGLVRGWCLPKSCESLLNRRLLRQFLASFSFLSLLVLLPPLARATASLGDAGALSLFNYAYKLVELPMGVAIGAIVTVLLPRLAGDFAQSGLASAQASLAAGMRATLWITLGIAVPAIFFADALVQLAFFKAAFSAEQTTLLAGLVATGFFFLPFQGLLNIYGSAFAAIGQTRPLVYCATGMLAMILVAAPLGHQALGLKGVMLGYGSVYLVGATGLSWRLRDAFGPGVWSSALANAVRGLLIPTIVAVATAMIGDNIGEGVAERILWACAAFLMYLASALLLDAGLRKHLAGLRKWKRD